MSLLRLYASLGESPTRCRWALLDGSAAPVSGEDALTDLPRRSERVQLILPAAQVLLTRARLPAAARRNAGSVLAFAVEAQTSRDPDDNQVCWLGRVGADTALAVLDKAGLARWRDALAAVGIRGFDLHCETLLLPCSPGEWSLAWDGREGFVRCAEFEGFATDCGAADQPPLALRLHLAAAQVGGVMPTAIAVHTAGADAIPDIDAWTRELGVPVRCAGLWTWRNAAATAGVALAQERPRWRALAGTATRLRPAAWLMGAALALHALALTIDWGRLAHEQRSLRQQMEAQFRAAFPDAVAVVDPALQMRRKLADARHGLGQADNGDFLRMIAPVSAALQLLPAGSLRSVSYEGGRMALELGAIDAASLQRVQALLRQSGLRAETEAAATADTGLVLTVRPA